MQIIALAAANLQQTMIIIGTPIQISRERIIRIVKNVYVKKKKKDHKQKEMKRKCIFNALLTAQ